MNDNTTARLELNAAPAGDSTPPADPPVEDSASQIQKGITALFPDPNTVVEIRVPKAGKYKTISGYFRASSPNLIESLQKLSGQSDGVYVTLNPCKEALYSRAADRLEYRASITTADRDISNRTHLLIDIDPVRPAGISATDAEIAQAREVSVKVFKHLKLLGWATPLTAKSGNGFHLIYNIDLSNDKESTELMKAVLKALATKFDTEFAKVDTSVFNAARIVKAYGTLAAKGDDTPERPHRVAELMSVGDGVVTKEQLQAVVMKAPSSAPMKSTSTAATSFEITPEQMEANLALCEVAHAEAVVMKDGRYKWVLTDGCPFNPDHIATGDKVVAVFLGDKLGFKCFHSSCSNNGWKEFRAKVEETSGQRMSFGSSGTVTVGVVEEIIAPTVEPAHTDEMTDAVLDGRLGEICQTRLGIFPLPYAWISLVTAAGTLVPRAAEDAGGVMVGVPNNRTRANVFGCLIGASHTGKTLTSEQSFYALGLMKGQSHSRHLLMLKAGSAEGLVAKIDSTAAGESRLFYPGELIHLLDKVSIAKSSFQALLNDAFDYDRQSLTLAHGKEIDFYCRLSILGGLVEELFDQGFGSQTVGGLYDRFLFGHHADKEPFAYDESLLNFDAEDLHPVAVTIDPAVYQVTKSWLQTGELTNPRVIHLALKAAITCASFDGRSRLLPQDLAPTLALAKYQEHLRTRFTPNAGENPVAMCEISIVNYLTQHPGWQQHSRIYRGIHAHRHGEEVFGRAIKALLNSSRIKQAKDGNAKLYMLTFEVPESQLRAALDAPTDWGDTKVKFVISGNSSQERGEQ